MIIIYDDIRSSVRGSIESKERKRAQIGLKWNKSYFPTGDEFLHY